jgi:hypothetical protein
MKTPLLLLLLAGSLVLTACETSVAARGHGRIHRRYVVSEPSSGAYYRERTYYGRRSYDDDAYQTRIEVRRPSNRGPLDRSYGF